MPAAPADDDGRAIVYGGGRKSLDRSAMPLPGRRGGGQPALSTETIAERASACLLLTLPQKLLNPIQRIKYPIIRCRSDGAQRVVSQFQK